MAELLGSDRQRKHRRERRLQFGHAAARSEMHAVRLASGARVRRRPRPNRLALLYELGCTFVLSETHGLVLMTTKEACWSVVTVPGMVVCALSLLILAVGVSSTQSDPEVQSKAEEVAFPADGRQLHGFLWKPEGIGPFAAVIWNHGSEKLPGSQPALARFYVAHSYVFFVPHRRGQGRSPGDYIQDLVAQAPPGERARRMVELQQAEAEDVVAALNFLRSKPFVDAARIAISGCSYGGIQTLLAGERDLGVKALVAFAPGAMSWEQNVALQDRLVRAVDLANAPVFLIQAENDYSLSPSRVLSKEANKKQKTFRSKIFPTFGSSHQDGHWGFCSSATSVWGPDVLAF